jgi:hypothetical protein
MMENYRREYYANIPVPPRKPSPASDDSDDAYGPDYPPPRNYMSIRRGDTMAKAMDHLNAVIMAVQGITPEEAAARREKRVEEEELKAQEASRSKVVEWMNTSTGMPSVEQDRDGHS